MSKQASYHQHFKAPLLLDVLRKHADGTVDLGLNGVTVVAACEVTESAVPGAATLDGGKPKAASAKSKKAAAASDAVTETAEADADAEAETEAESAEPEIPEETPEAGLAE